MLLSDTKTAEFINTHFVASWESIRPVPQVTIDFGNGEVLRRTLAGNTILAVVTPDGRLLDALPGVYTPDDFQSELKPMVEFVGKLRELTDDSARRQALLEYHRGRVSTAVQRDMRSTLSKAFVETPLLDALARSAPRSIPAPRTVPAPATESAPASAN